MKTTDFLNAKMMITLMIIGMTTQIANAQFNLSVGVGLSHSDMKVISSSGNEQLTSPISKPAIGLFLEYVMGNYGSVVFEPTYLEKGATLKANRTNPDITMEMKYIELPIFYKVSFGKKVNPYVKAGPSLGILLDSKAETQPGLATVGHASMYSANLNDILTKVDIGLSLGAGIRIPWGHVSLFADGRYTVGLNDIDKGGQIYWHSSEEDITVESNPKAKMYNQRLQLMAGVTIPIGN